MRARRVAVPWLVCQDALGEGELPAALLRATRREAADSFEQRLFDASNRSYVLVVALRERFTSESVSSGMSVPAMESLDQIKRLLVQRGLLPRLRNRLNPLTHAFSVMPGDERAVGAASRPTTLRTSSFGHMCRTIRRVGLARQSGGICLVSTCSAVTSVRASNSNRWWSVLRMA
jgi:hypothetical protein